jgi:DNA-directed RNA polymerase specialized sigma24 family protein
MGAARTLTAAAFARLLARLHSDPDEAAAEYERLRVTLVRFFDWRGAWSPDECADDTLDRIADKLESGTPIEDLRRYAYGVAQLVLLERLRQQSRTPVSSFPDPASLIAAAPQAAPSPLAECFERCLEAVRPATRAVLLQYYTAEGRTRIENRRRLAASIGISDSALRSRVQRLRDRLEHCTLKCAAAAEQLGLGAALRDVSPVGDTLEMKASRDD